MRSAALCNALREAFRGHNTKSDYGLSCVWVHNLNGIAFEIPLTGNAHTRGCLTAVVVGGRMWGPHLHKVVREAGEILFCAVVVGLYWKWQF